jgi:BirA family transcriptional regulator, biotin operon repressor / biotin---[acetyl-CoA-carboxylase] ligase
MRFFHYPSLPSTNHQAKLLLQSNMVLLEEGCVVTADTQTQGRGTRGRDWFSNDAGGLYYSLAIKPKVFNVSKLDVYHLDVAKAVQTVVKDITDITLDIKPPNDLFLNGKKVAGILMESSLRSNLDVPDLNYIIIGIGLNVNQTVFPNALQSIATSLSLFANQSFGIKDFVQPLTSKIISDVSLV